MPTQIGDLFVSLGIKGSDKTISAIATVKSGMGEIASTSLEAKAAIVGALYALQQMTSASGTNAQGLMNLNAALGINIETLERYRYVAERFGSSKGAMDSAFQSLSSITAEYMATGHAPARLSLIAGQIHDDGFLQALQSGDYPKVIQYLQKFAKSGIAKNQILAGLNSMGMGGIAAQLMRGAFTSKNLADAPVTSAGTIGALDKMEQRFKTVEAHFDKMRDSMVVKWGPQFATDMEKLIKPLEDLIDSFGKLDKSLGLLQKTGLIFEGWAHIFESIAFLVDSFTDPKKMQLLKEGMQAFAQGLLGSSRVAVPNASELRLPSKDAGPNQWGIGQVIYNVEINGKSYDPSDIIAIKRGLMEAHIKGPLNQQLNKNTKSSSATSRGP